MLLAWGAMANMHGGTPYWRTENTRQTFGMDNFPDLIQTQMDMRPHHRLEHSEQMEQAWLTWEETYGSGQLIGIGHMQTETRNSNQAPVVKKHNEVEVFYASQAGAMVIEYLDGAIQHQKLLFIM